MPIADDPARGPRGRRLLDAEGRLVGNYEHDEREGAIYADLFDRAPGVDAEHAAAAVLADLRGRRVVGDEALGRALIAAGGRQRRHVHILTRAAAPIGWSEPPGYRLTDVDRPAADLVDAYRAAYPPGHLDHWGESPKRSREILESYLSGAAFGPLLPGSGLAVAADGSVVAAAILATVPGDPPAGGAWVIELFRHPAHPGTGRPLLERALALSTAPQLGLMVTEGNRARGLYEELGFEVVRSLLSVEL